MVPRVEVAGAFATRTVPGPAACAACAAGAPPAMSMRWREYPAGWSSPTLPETVRQTSPEMPPEYRWYVVVQYAMLRPWGVSAAVSRVKGMQSREERVCARRGPKVTASGRACDST